MPDRLATVSPARGAVSIVCRPADHRPANEKGGAEESEPDNDPRMAEVPGVAGEDKPDPETKHNQARGRSASGKTTRIPARKRSMASASPLRRATTANTVTHTAPPSQTIAARTCRNISQSYPVAATCIRPALAALCP